MWGIYRDMSKSNRGPTQNGRERHRKRWFFIRRLSERKRRRISRSPLPRDIKYGDLILLSSNRFWNVWKAFGRASPVRDKFAISACDRVIASLRLFLREYLYISTPRVAKVGEVFFLAPRLLRSSFLSRIGDAFDRGLWFICAVTKGPKPVIPERYMRRKKKIIARYTVDIK